MSKNTNWADAMRVDESRPSILTKYRMRRKNPALMKYDMNVVGVTVALHLVFAFVMAVTMAVKLNDPSSGAISTFWVAAFLFSIPFFIITLPIVQLVMKLANKEP